MSDPDDERPEAPAAGHDDTGLELARSLARAAKAASRARSAGRTRNPRRAKPAELSGAHPGGRDPTTIGAVVDKLVTESGWGADVAVHGVFARWGSIVGADIAAHCAPESFADGKLLIRTDSTAWANELRLQAPTVVRRLNEELGHDTVAIIDILGPDAPSWSKGRRSVRGARGPRDTYG